MPCIFKERGIWLWFVAQCSPKFSVGGKNTSPSLRAFIFAPLQIVTHFIDG